MRNKRSLKKKLIIAAIIIASALVAIDIIIANAAIDLALVNAVDSDMNVAPESVVDAEVKKSIETNKERSDADTKVWFDGRDVENVNVVSDDGYRLCGELFENDNNLHKWAICVHGYVSNRTDVRPAAKCYYENGFNVLSPDLRVHGESEGKYIGMGWLDRKDLLCWIKLITDRDPGARIVLHGFSMGAAAVMMAAGDEDLPPNVVAAVEDCGYTSVWDVFSDEVRNYFHLPAFPILHTASVFTKLRAGYSFTEASALEQIKKVRIPVMFIHGSADNFVDLQMVYRLYGACPSQKKIYVAEGAGHSEAYYLDMEKYKSEVISFLNLLKKKRTSYE